MLLGVLMAGMLLISRLLSQRVKGGWFLDERKLLLRGRGKTVLS